MWNNDNNDYEKVYLAGVDSGDDEDFLQSMEELKGLAKACFYEPAGVIVQKSPQVNREFCMGSGKVIELKDILKNEKISTVIFDNFLSPVQLNNLQKVLNAAVLDRTGLILEIFSIRAKTKTSKLQVEEAKLKYMLPRLTGMRTNLNRQGGGSGSLSNKGAGEKKLELDRRRIEHRLHILRKELNDVTKEQNVQRKCRKKSNIKKVSLVGYTNAGKSTVFNNIVSLYLKDDRKKVFEKDMLFATLETSVRKISFKDHKDFFLSDTVGFIHKLPHDLIEAFHSTLEEISDADLILYIIDFSNPYYKQHIQVTQDTLRQLGAEKIPVLYVYNKLDLKEPGFTHRMQNDNSLYLSAKNYRDIEKLVDKIKEILYRDRVEKRFLFPYDKGNVMSALLQDCEIIEQKYVENGVRLVVNCDKEDALRYSEYALEE